MTTPLDKSSTGDIESPRNGTSPVGGWFAAALAVAVGQTGSAAAAVGNVSLRTLRRWQRRPAFKAIVEEIRAEMISGTLGKLLAANGQAVDALTSLLSSQFDNVKLGAAGRLLDLTLRARRQLDTEAELEEVKADWIKFRAEQPQLFKGENTHYDRSSND